MTAPRETFVLVPFPHPARENALAAVRRAPDGMVVQIQEKNRTLEQNALQWPILAAWAKFKEWPVDGKLQKISADDWKDVLTSAFRRETVRVAQGLDGGMVLLGARTSKFSVREFSEWIEFLLAASAEHEIPVNRTEIEQDLRRYAA